MEIYKGKEIILISPYYSNKTLTIDEAIKRSIVCKITKVGRKYFYIDDYKFLIGNTRSYTNDNYPAIIYESIQDMKNIYRKNYLIKKLYRFNNYNKMTLDVLEKINTLIKTNIGDINGKH